MRKRLLVHYEVKGSLLRGRETEGGNTTREIMSKLMTFCYQLVQVESRILWIGNDYVNSMC